MFIKIYYRVLIFLLAWVLLTILTIILSKVYDLEKSKSEFNYEYNKEGFYSNNNVCNLYRCSSILVHGEMYYFERKNVVYHSSYIPRNINVVSDYYFDFANGEFNIKLHNVSVYVDIFKQIEKEIFLAQALAPLIIILIFLYTLYIIRSERTQNILINSANEALVSQKSTMILSENIHHELNTPLDIIDNKVSKIKGFMLKVFTEHPDLVTVYPKSVKLVEDFDYIFVSLSQINNILNKMKEIKNIRYSSDKTFKEIIDHSISISHISSAEFLFSVDNKLRKFKPNNDKISNSDLINVIINHIKNSVEANSSKIDVQYSNFHNSVLSFTITDNGSGMDSDTLKKVFLPNFSDKGLNKNIRGNGMYINQYLLKESGGDLKIQESNIGIGTTILIAVPAIIIEAVKE